MVNDDGWTDWKAHDGAGLPCGFEGSMPVWIEVECSSPKRKGRIEEGITTVADTLPQCWDWSQFGKPHPNCGCGKHFIPRILRYRLRKSPEAEKLIEACKNIEAPKTPERVEELVEV